MKKHSYCQSSKELVTVLIQNLAFSYELEYCFDSIMFETITSKWMFKCAIASATDIPLIAPNSEVTEKA